MKLKIYYDILKDVKGVKFIKNIEYGIDKTAPFSAWLLLDSKYELDKILAALLYNGIPVGKFKYDVVSNIDYFKSFMSIDINHNYSNSKNIRNRSLFLPIYENLYKKDIEKIAKEFLKIINEYEKNPNAEIFNKDILNEKIKYFNGFYIR